MCCKSQVKFVHKKDSEEDGDQFADARNDFAFLMSCDVHDVSHNDDDSDTFVDAHGDVCLDANGDKIYFDSEDDDDDEYYDAQDDHTHCTLADAQVGHTHCTQADAQVGRTHGTQADVVDDVRGYENSFAFSSAHSAYPESVDLNVGTVPLSAVIESGASINILDQETWEMLKKKNIKCTSQKTSGRKLFAYGHEKPLSVLGTFQAEVDLFVVRHEQNRQRCEFVVISEKCITLLGKESAEKLNVLRVGLPNDVHTCSVTEKPENKAEFSDLFKGLGKLKNKQIKLHVEKDVKPVVQKARRIPFSLRQKVEKKIEELEALDIIERADGPTSFVSPIVVVPKPNGDVRLSVDMRQANEGIQRECFPIPTVEETLIEMNASKVFSKLDLNMGFHQIELDEASRPITTFTTHAGLFRYKRLMFGVSSAPEIYQYTIQQVLKDCPGCKNMTDDIIIYADSVEEHDRRLEKVLTTLKENGLTLNKDKCLHRMDQLQFMGFLLSEKGIGPSSEKVRNAERPKSASEVRSFLGLVNFNARFIPDLATKSEALRRLTRKDHSFKWGAEQEKAFQRLKDDLAKATELAYFDPQAPTKVIADASPVGLGAVLIQTQEGVLELKEKISECEEGKDFEINASVVESLFTKLNVKKAAVPDSISGKLLKVCASQLCSVFANLFNWSLRECCVPSVWKNSVICPILKKKNPSSLNDYRPVALTSIVMKCFEKLILRCLLTFTSEHLDPLQFAYKPHRGTDDAILTILHNAFLHFDKAGSNVRILFIDFSSAFNTIQPHLLALKLLHLDVNPKLILWIVNFLLPRTQSVCFQNSISSKSHTCIGAPQGTVLSPALFTLYTNDCQGITKTPIVKYSDDTAIEDLSNSDSVYFSEVHKFSAWCKESYLDLNIVKTKEMVVDFRKNPPPVPELIIDDVAVERVAEYRYLGTVLDNNLTFDRNVDTVVHNKCHSLIYCLQKLRNIGVASDILEMYYHACIRSVLTLSFMCWYGSLGVHGKKVLNDVVNVCSKVVEKKQACVCKICTKDY